MREILQGEARHCRASGCLLVSNTLGDTEQEGASACRGVKDRYRRVAQPLGFQIVPQSAVQGADHVLNNLNGRVVDAKAFTRIGIKCTKKIFVEVKNGIASGWTNSKYLR